MVSNFISRTPPLFLDLAKVLQGDIDCSLETLKKYSVDGSPYEVHPQAVMYPKDALDIKHILSFAREYTMPVTVRGSGESRKGGALGDGIIIDLRRYMSRIRSVNMMNHTVTVDAGASIYSLLEKLHSWNFDIPLFSSQDESTTIGGALATKSATAYSAFHGSVREWVESVTVVVDTGEEHNLHDGVTPSGRLLAIYQSLFPLLTKESPIIRAGKPASSDDATGYNIWNTSIGPRQLIDQLAGSEGTLGIITSVTFRISPYKKHAYVTCIPLQDKEALEECLYLAKAHNSEGMFLYDKDSMELSQKYRPTVLPYFLNSAYTLLVLHRGEVSEAVEKTVNAFQETLPLERHLVKTLTGTELFERVSHPSYFLSLCEEYSKGTLFPVTIADGLIVKPQHLKPFLVELEKYLEFFGRPSLITGGVASGHISVTTLFDTKKKTYGDDLSAYGSSIFSLVKKYNGGISAQGGEGLARTPYLNHIYTTQTLALFKKIKNVWDPLFLFNPGKKGELPPHYLTSHLRTGDTLS